LPGDVIVSVDGEVVKSTEDVLNNITAVGKTMQIQIVRVQDEGRTTNLTLAVTSQAS